MSDLRRLPLRALRALHGLAPLRRVARRTLRGVTFSQRYHAGRIYFDAVDHSWAWTGRLRYESHDIDVQEALVRLAAGRRTFVDIGSNIGAMTLRVLMSNPDIRARCFDANARALALLERSLRANGLEGRAELRRAVVAPEAGVQHFDDSMSVAGHVSATGRALPAIAFAGVIADAVAAGPCLVKVDIEGFETALLPHLPPREALCDVCLVTELHPLGMNGAGDPEANLAVLRASGGTVTHLDGTPLTSIAPSGWTNVVVTWGREERGGAVPVTSAPPRGSR